MGNLIIDFSKLGPNDIKVFSNERLLYQNFPGWRVSRIFTSASEEVPAFYVVYKENKEDSPYAVCTLTSYSTKVSSSELAQEVGEWSPGGDVPPGPYVPDPYLKVTAYSDDCYLMIGSRIKFIGLELSSDLKTWSPIDMIKTWSTIDMIDDDGGGYITQGINVNNGDSIYIRSSQSINGEEFTYFIINGSIKLEGNLYSVFGPNSSDWEVLRVIVFYYDSVGTELLHLPDLPASTLPDGMTYDDIFNYQETHILEYVDCQVSNDGKNFNFYIGVTPQDLYDAGVISAATNYVMAEYLGNTNGFDGPDLPYYAEFYESYNDSDLRPYSNLKDLLITTNGVSFNNKLYYDNESTISFTARYGGRYSWELSYDEGNTWQVIPMESSELTITGIQNGTWFKYIPAT